MAIQVVRHTITVEEFERMLHAGVFGVDARIELIRGEIVDMSPIGDRYIGCVMLLDLLFHEQVGRRASILVQSPVELPGNTRPYPDLCLLKWRDDLYRRKRPTHEDVLLLVEVADSSLGYDLGDKLEIYVEASIPEYWVIDLQHNEVNVFSTPGAGKYKQTQTLSRGQKLPLPAGLGGELAVDDLLGS